MLERDLQIRRISEWYLIYFVFVKISCLSNCHFSNVFPNATQNKSYVSGLFGEGGRTKELPNMLARRERGVCSDVVLVKHNTTCIRLVLSYVINFTSSSQNEPISLSVTSESHTLIQSRELLSTFLARNR